MAAQLNRGQGGGVVECGVKLNVYSPIRDVFANANNSSSLGSGQERNYELKGTKHKLKLDTSSVNI